MSYSLVGYTLLQNFSNRAVTDSNRTVRKLWFTIVNSPKQMTVHH